MGGALESGRGGEPEKYEIPVYGVPVYRYAVIHVRVRVRKNEKNLLLPVPVDLH